MAEDGAPVETADSRRILAFYFRHKCRRQKQRPLLPSLSKQGELTIWGYSILILYEWRQYDCADTKFRAFKSYSGKQEKTCRYT